MHTFYCKQTQTSVIASKAKQSPIFHRASPRVIADCFVTLFLAMTGVFFISSCNNGDEFHKPENALDAGREFIQQSLQGKFNNANRYMLQNEDNDYLLGKWSEDFNKLTEHDKAAYAKASINIAEVTDVIPDSITIISFSNSYKKMPQKIKVVKQNGEWLVDFKYTFSGNL